MVEDEFRLTGGVPRYPSEKEKQTGRSGKADCILFIPESMFSLSALWITFEHHAALNR